MKLECIKRVTMIVESLEKCRQFYTEVLGLEEIPAGELDYPAQFYRVGESQEIQLTEWKDQKSFRGHLSLVVDDFGEAFQKFKKLQIIDSAPYGKPRRLRDGTLQMFIRDPAGNLLEICQHAPGEVDPAILADPLFDAEGREFRSGRRDARGLRSTHRWIHKQREEAESG